MPGGRSLPGLGLQAFFDPGEGGWDDDMSLNLLKLSILPQLSVIDFVSVEPGGPVEGDIYLLDETHATNANEVAVYDDGMWKYLGPPVEGWRAYVQALSSYLMFDGATWEGVS